VPRRFPSQLELHGAPTACRQPLLPEQPVWEPPRPPDCSRVPDWVDERQSQHQLSSSLWGFEPQHEGPRFAGCYPRSLRERRSSCSDAEPEDDSVARHVVVGRERRSDRVPVLAGRRDREARDRPRRGDVVEGAKELARAYDGRARGDQAVAAAAQAGVALGAAGDEQPRIGAPPRSNVGIEGSTPIVAGALRVDPDRRFDVGERPGRADQS